MNVGRRHLNRLSAYFHRKETMCCTVGNTDTIFVCHSTYLTPRATSSSARTWPTVGCAEDRRLCTLPKKNMLNRAGNRGYSLTDACDKVLFVSYSLARTSSRCRDCTVGRAKGLNFYFLCDLKCIQFFRKGAQKLITRAPCWQESFRCFDYTKCACF